MASAAMAMAIMWRHQWQRNQYQWHGGSEISIENVGGGIWRGGESGVKAKIISGIIEWHRR
jgi:hypothetical protein